MPPDELSDDELPDASVVLPCAELAPTITFFVERLGFRLDRISPADDPRAADLSGHGLQLRLRRDAHDPPATLHLPVDPLGASHDSPRELRAPNGTRIEFGEVARASSPGAPSREIVVDRGDAPGRWVAGRAGMRYRDLVPGRAGGRFIASRIQVPDGGPVPDRVHFHAVRAQTIFCVQGWVRVVYEDQGEPFVLEPGDLVLQPPGIRHRVLESSPGLEVLECACPAEHDTHFDHGLELPTRVLRPARDFGGQRFVRSIASDATWDVCAETGLACRDTGVAAATGGVAGVRVLRAARAGPDAHAGGDAQPMRAPRPDAGYRFLHVLGGSVELVRADGDALRLAGRDSVLVPPGVPCALGAASADLELFELRLDVAD
ncbi:MAG: cupin domain-containing protein [Planctomycetes bacterium]|nr:cupin domain-containing protein [Planctomycetota bacterium]